MSKRNVPDVNTPENYDEIYFGPRTEQLLAYDDFIDLLKELNTGGNALDIGCGLGRYFSAFEGCKIYGTELSLKTIAKTKQDYPESEIVQWFAGTPLPFPDNMFNLVWAGEFLEHIQSPRQAVDEIYRVMKPGAKALFVTPVGNNSECPEHLWFFDDEDIKTLFDNYNVEVSKVHEDTRYQIILTK